MIKHDMSGELRNVLIEDSVGKLELSDEMLGLVTGGGLPVNNPYQTTMYASCVTFPHPHQCVLPPSN